MREAALFGVNKFPDIEKEVGAFFRANWPAFHGTVARSGIGTAILELPFAPSDYPGLSRQLQQGNFVRLCGAWLEEFAGRKVKEIDLSIIDGRHFTGFPDLLSQKLSLHIHFRENPPVGQPKLTIDDLLPQQSSSGRKSLERFQHNMKAFNGYVARNGCGYSLLSYIGPRLEDGELTVQEQNHQATKIRAVWHDRFDRLRATQETSFSIERGFFLSAEELSQEYLTLIRFKNHQAPKRANSAEELRPEFSGPFAEVISDYLELNRRAFDGVVGRNGKGWAIVELVAPFGVRGAPSVEDCYREFTKHLTSWHGEYPDREVERLSFKRKFGFDLRAVDSDSETFNTIRLTALLRFREGEHEQMYAALGMANFQADRVHNEFADSHYHQAGLRRTRLNRPAEEGFVARDGNGFSLIEQMFAPVGPGEIWRPEVNLQFCKYLVDYEDRYPNREVSGLHYQEGEGDFLQPDLVSPRRAVVLPFRDHSGGSSEVTPEVIPSTHYENESARRRNMNVEAESGVQVQDGRFVAYIEDIAPPVAPGEAHPAVVPQANFVRRLVDYKNRHPDRQFRNRCLVNRWSAHLKPADPSHIGFDFGYLVFGDTES